MLPFQAMPNPSNQIGLIKGPCPYCCMLAVSLAHGERSCLYLSHAAPFALHSTPDPTIPFLVKPVQTLFIFSTQLNSCLLFTYFTTPPISNNSFIFCVSGGHQLYIFIVFFFCNLISQFVLNSGGEERTTSWAPFNLVFFPLFIHL